MGWYEEHRKALMDELSASSRMFVGSLKNEHPDIPGLADMVSRAKQTGADYKSAELVDHTLEAIRRSTGVTPSNAEQHFNSVIPKIVERLGLEMPPPSFVVDPSEIYAGRASPVGHKIIVKSCESPELHYSTVLEELHHLDYYGKIGYRPEHYDAALREITTRMANKENPLTVLAEMAKVPVEKAQAAVEALQKDKRWEGVAVPIDYAYVALLQPGSPSHKEAGFFGNPEAREAFVRFDEGQARYREMKGARKLDTPIRLLTIAQMYKFLHDESISLQPSPGASLYELNALRHDLDGTRGMVMFARLQKDAVRPGEESPLKKLYSACRSNNAFPGFNAGGELVFYRWDGKKAPTDHILRQAFGKKAEKMSKRMHAA